MPSGAVAPVEQGGDQARPASPGAGWKAAAASPSSDGGGGRDRDQAHAVVDDGVAEAQVEDAELLPGVGPDPEDGAARRAEAVDGGPGQAQHELGGQAVAHLGVDVVGADDALGQLGPGVGVLVGETGAAEHGDRRRGPSGGRP